MILNLLKNLRHGRLSRYQKFWVFWGSIYRKIILILNYQRPCKKKISNFGPFNFHPIFFLVIMIIGDLITILFITK